MKKVFGGPVMVSAKLESALKLAGGIGMGDMPEEMRKELSRAKFGLEQVAAQWRKLTEPVPCGDGC